MTNLRLVLAQLNSTVGDIAGNSRQIEAVLKEARALEADIALFPELAITGYPPEDLLLKPDFLQVARDALERLRPATKELIAIIGLPYVDGDLYNSAAVLQDGQLAGIYHKQHLPNYSVFDEKRYFDPGNHGRHGRRPGGRQADILSITVVSLHPASLRFGRREIDWNERGRLNNMMVLEVTLMVSVKDVSPSRFLKPFLSKCFY